MAVIYYSIDEASKILKINPKKLWKYVHSGEIKSCIIKDQVRIRAEDLQLFIKKQSPVKKPARSKNPFEIDPTKDVNEYLDKLKKMEKNL